MKTEVVNEDNLIHISGYGGEFVYFIYYAYSIEVNCDFVTMTDFY